MDWRSLSNNLNKGFQTSVQATKERLGRVAPDEITELPQEYKDLEAQVDALKAAHMAFLKITKIYESESYDYPSQIQESLAELSTSFGQGISALRGKPATPASTPEQPALVPHAPPPAPMHKTLPHALTRASRSAAGIVLTASPGQQDTALSSALETYADGMDKVAAARVDQAGPASCRVPPSSMTSSIGPSYSVKLPAPLAAKPDDLDCGGAESPAGCPNQSIGARWRQADVSVLQCFKPTAMLIVCVSSLKNANPSRQEQARLEVENAEDDLVQKTEVAIQLMQKVLQNVRSYPNPTLLALTLDEPEPIKQLNELAKAQLMFHAIAAETLANTQAVLEEMSAAATEAYS
ncbi:unnamed protein product [Mycena citricolor]|uniref:Uncharacterized protein n=1 Tax=Mycena citricolor TaxID=2018698 RepID=A0AAD2H330_9AGAR|nr:unnamed protein product [Mycena citricolor]